MKRIILPLILIGCMSFTTNASGKADPIADFDNITFFGVDFSKSRIYGSTDTPDKLRKAYADLNMLFITESGKYDIAKLLGKNVKDVRIDAVTDMNDSIPDNAIKTMSSSYMPDSGQTANTVKELNTFDYSGIGFVVVAQLLNKPAENATYMMVFFDIETRTILKQFQLNGEPGGIGVRNFWAASVLDALGKIRKYRE